MEPVFRSPRMAVGAIVFLLLLLPQTSFAQQADVLDVENAVICRNVIDRQPIDAGTIFFDSVGQLYCFTKIVGAKNATTISHVWYYGNTEMFRKPLSVKAFTWRTYSLKRIPPYATGAWHVDILDAAGNRLEVINFQIMQQ